MLDVPLWGKVIGSLLILIVCIVALVFPVQSLKDEIENWMKPFIFGSIVFVVIGSFFLILGLFTSELLLVSLLLFAGTLFSLTFVYIKHSYFKSFQMLSLSIFLFILSGLMFA